MNIFKKGKIPGVKVKKKTKQIARLKKDMEEEKIAKEEINKKKKQ